MEEFFNWTAMHSPLGTVIYATNRIPKMVRGSIDNIQKLTAHLRDTKAKELDSETLERFDLIEIKP